jgi:hypothetical protein
VWSRGAIIVFIVGSSVDAAGGTVGTDADCTQPEPDGTTVPPVDQESRSTGPRPAARFVATDIDRHTKGQ